MDRMVGGIIRFMVGLFFFFFLLFSSSSLNSFKPTAGDGNGNKVEIFSVLLFLVF